MFAGFNLELEEWISYTDFEKGKEIEKKHKDLVKATFRRFVNSD